MTRYRIGIDARMEKPWRTGLGRYARALVFHLTASPADDIHWVIIKHPKLANERLAAPGSDAQEVVVPGDLDLTENLGAAKHLHPLSLDLYHATHHFLPLRLRGPRVVLTLHDLIWVEHAHLSYFGWRGRLRGVGVMAWGRLTMQHALRRADRVIAISDASRDAALARYPFLNPAHINVVHHGVDAALFPARTGPEGEPPYLFCLGNSRPYKNLDSVIKAFADIAPDYPTLTLKITGRGDATAHLDALAERLGVSARIQFLGMVSDKAIVDLFHQARALVFPSRIEGFGFPVIEAQRMGCPVITSDIPVLREIAGQGALFVRPELPKDIARGMRRVLDNPQLRQRLRHLGALNADRFRWDPCAAQTLAVYRELLRA